MTKEKVKLFLNKLSRYRLLLHLAGMALVVLLLFLGLRWWLLIYTHHGEGIEVPDFYGMDYRDAIDTAEELGLRITVNDSTYINPREMPAGCIVVQSPTKGMNVKEGRMIYVTINSLNIPRVKIPNLIENSSYREAQARLRQLEFRLLPPKLIDGEKDWVYGILLDGRNVQNGQQVARESQLTLVIGNGAYEDEDDDYIDDDDFTVGDSLSGDATPEQPAEDAVDDFEPVSMDDFE